VVPCLEQGWYCLKKRIESGIDVEKSRSYLLESIVSLEPVFADKEYFLSEEFNLLDCYIAPLLWRMPQLGITIPESATGIHEYMKRVFARDSFQKSLTDCERELRAA